MVFTMGIMQKVCQLFNQPPCLALGALPVAFSAKTFYNAK